MRGDFTRDTFDPGKQYSRVLMQQGRVQLDADWNEQTSILLHYIRALARDLFGSHAGPAEGAGFDIISKLTTDRQKILKDMHKEGQFDEARLNALGKAVEAGNLVITRGRYYVGGIPLLNDRALLYTEQAGVPLNETKDEERANRWKTNVVLYVDVWERHVTWLDDPHIREVALGGPDTCTRAQVCWQVRSLLPEGGKIDCTAISKLTGGTGTLRAMAHHKAAPELCVMSPEARYRGAENQLYRVEIHEGGTADKATFKWSRENGSVGFPITSASFNGKTATLGHMGRDRRSGLKDGDWVEVIDDIIVSGSAPGLLARVKGPPQHLTVALEPASNPALFPSYVDPAFAGRHPILLRWDHAGDAKAGGAIPIGKAVDSANGWAELEDGVRVQFAAKATYRSGDYWRIPARVATGDVDWPSELKIDGAVRTDSDGNRIGAALPPHGPARYYAPLAHWDGSAWHDCRRILKPLPTA